LEPDAGELAVSEPSVVATRRRFSMFYVSHAGEETTVDVATSRDGVSWQRRGNTLGPEGPGVNLSHPRSPCAVKLHDNKLRLWYAARPAGDIEDGFRLWSVDHTEARSP
jgi:hypothetical protein